MFAVRTCKLIVMLRRCTRTTGSSFIKMIFFFTLKKQTKSCRWKCGKCVSERERQLHNNNSSCRWTTEQLFHTVDVLSHSPSQRLIRWQAARGRLAAKSTSFTMMGRTCPLLPPCQVSNIPFRLNVYPSTAVIAGFHLHLSLSLESTAIRGQQITGCSF